MLHNREDPSFLVLTEALGFYKGEGTNHFQRRLDNVQAPGLSNRLVDLRITQLGPSFDYLSDKQRIKIEFFERNSLDWFDCFEGQIGNLKDLRQVLAFYGIIFPLDPPTTEDLGEEGVITRTQGFALHASRADIDECQRLLRQNKIQKVNLDVPSSLWNECYLEVTSSKDGIYTMYLWPTAYLTYTSRVDGFVQTTTSLQEVATFILEPRKIIANMITL